MDMRTNRAVNEAPAAEAPATRMVTGGSGGGLLQKILAVSLILAALIVAGTYGMRAFSGLMADSAVKGKQYQAVFLTNGQVYFGKVSKVDNSYVKLTDIYYLQVQQQVQPEDKSKSSTEQPQVSLAKLGGELHGPEDIMYISRTQVLFWENLKTDGKVATAIKDYKAQGNK
jgi:hypothetical protein